MTFEKDVYAHHEHESSPVLPAALTALQTSAGWLFLRVSILLFPLSHTSSRHHVDHAPTI